MFFYSERLTIAGNRCTYMRSRRPIAQRSEQSWQLSAELGDKYAAEPVTPRTAARLQRACRGYAARDLLDADHKTQVKARGQHLRLRP